MNNFGKVTVSLLGLNNGHEVYLRTMNVIRHVTLGPKTEAWDDEMHDHVARMTPAQAANVLEQAGIATYIGEHSTPDPTPWLSEIVGRPWPTDIYEVCFDSRVQPRAGCTVLLPGDKVFDFAYEMEASGLWWTHGVAKVETR